MNFITATCAALQAVNTVIMDWALGVPKPGFSTDGLSKMNVIGASTP